jgi:hypothetical protein
VTTTVSKVKYSHDVMLAFLNEVCADLAKNGGSFTVRDYFEGGSWWTEYTIDFPEAL